MSLSSFFVYFLRCSDGSLYCGWTTDLERRLSAHNGLLKGGAKYTSSRRPCELVFFKSCKSKVDALKTEIAMKKLKKNQKENLVEQWSNPRSRSTADPELQPEGYRPFGG